MPKLTRGVTFIELIISMVIISVAVMGVFSAFSTTIGHSADPMIQEQAVLIGESYMEEILAKAYDEQDVSDVPDVGGPDAGETSRSLYDDVDDYNGLTPTSVADQTGTAIVSLAAYQVTVSVVQDDASLGSPFAIAKRIDISVNHPVLSAPYRLAAYKADLTLP